MGEFFAGWRRKSACGVLALAVFLCLLWASSNQLYFAIDYAHGGWQYRLHSYSDEVTLSQYKLNRTPGGTHFQRWLFPKRDRLLMSIDSRRAVLSGEFERCGWLSSLSDQNPSDYAQVVIPYWPSVLGTTLLAAVLLFWNPNGRRSVRCLQAQGAGPMI